MRAFALLAVLLVAALGGSGCRARETCEQRLARLEKERSAIDARERKVLASVDAKDDVAERRFAERERTVKAEYERLRAEDVKGVAARYHALLRDPRATESGAAPHMNPKIEAAKADLATAEARAARVYGAKEQAELASLTAKRAAWRERVARCKAEVRGDHASQRRRVESQIAVERAALGRRGPPPSGPPALF